MIEASNFTNLKVLEQINYLEENSLVFIKKPFEDIGERPSKSVLLIEKPQVLELKTLPSHLKYAYLGQNSTLPIIVSTTLLLMKKKNY